MKDVLKVFNLTSNECYIKDDRNVLNNITFSIDSQDCLGVMASTSDESKILLEELANLRKIYSGYYVYQNTKAPNTSKLTVNHIFYLDGTRALINEMNVLEYLMHLTCKFNIKAIRRQKVIFNMLLEFGLGYISLSSISILTREERMLVHIFSALFSNSSFIIVNLNSYEFDNKNIEILKKIFFKLRETKTVLLATNQAKLVGICCNRILLIHKGEQAFFGTTLEIQQEYDKVMYVLRDKKIDELYKQIKQVFPKFTVKKQGKMVLICSKEGRFINNDTFYSVLAANNIFPSEVKINLGRISNAIENLVARIKENDI